MNLNLAVNAINNLWQTNGSDTCLYNGKLWHSGLIDFQNLNLEADRVVWFTNDSNRQDFYNGWAKEEGVRRNKNAYKSELLSNNNLRLANFNQEHFNQIMIDYLDSKHSNLNIALYSFCIKKGIDGIIRGEHLNEIAIITTEIPHLHFLNKTVL